MTSDEINVYVAALNAAKRDGDVRLEREIEKYLRSRGVVVEMVESGTRWKRIDSAGVVDEGDGSVIGT